MMTRINDFFLKNSVCVFLAACFFFCISTLISKSAFSQELDKAIVDYDVLFKDGLKKNGKLLNLAGKKIGDEGVKRLVSSGALARVEKLDLRYNEITSVGIEFLAKISPLSNLKILILRHNIIGDAGSVALAKSDSFPNLEEIQLGWTETRDAGAKAFGNSDKFKKLKKLDFRGNFLAGKTKELLKKSLSHLKTLKLF